MRRHLPQRRAPEELLPGRWLRLRAACQQPLKKACLLGRGSQPSQRRTLKLRANERAVNIRDGRQHIRIVLSQVSPNAGNDVVVFHGLNNAGERD